MCQDRAGMPAERAFNLPPLGSALSRRALLRLAPLASALAAGVVIESPSAAATSLLTTHPVIRPRSAWANATTPVRGVLATEAASDVLFALVHHTETANSYAAAQVPGLLRSFYRYHVSKGWPDIAYNFLVDRYGRIWEGRVGSLHHPVIPSATGGSQGFSQIACWIGNHRAAPPTAAAEQSMISLLALLCRRYDVDTSPGATVTFTSRGSNRWPRGARVTTRTIEGHRRMSLTDCPGDAAYAVVGSGFQSAVTTLNRPGADQGGGPPRTRDPHVPTGHVGSS